MELKDNVYFHELFELYLSFPTLITKSLFLKMFSTQDSVASASIWKLFVLSFLNPVLCCWFYGVSTSEPVASYYFLNVLISIHLHIHSGLLNKNYSEAWALKPNMSCWNSSLSVLMTSASSYLLNYFCSLSHFDDFVHYYMVFETYYRYCCIFHSASIQPKKNP